MGRRRRQATSEKLFDVLSELTEIFWQVGAIVSAVLMFATCWTLDWAFDQYTRARVSPLLGLLTQNFGSAYFLLPFVTAVFAVIFGVKSYQAFCKNHSS